MGAFLKDVIGGGAHANLSAPPGVPPQFRSRDVGGRRNCNVHANGNSRGNPHFGSEMGLDRRFNAQRCHVIAPAADTRVSGLGRCVRPTRSETGLQDGQADPVLPAPPPERVSGQPKVLAARCSRPVLQQELRADRRCAQHRSAKEAGADSIFTIEGMSLPHHSVLGDVARLVHQWKD
jgi:hypothetical protein